VGNAQLQGGEESARFPLGHLYQRPDSALTMVKFIKRLAVRRKFEGNPHPADCIGR
jgi:hypothetical protein